MIFSHILVDHKNVLLVIYLYVAAYQSIFQDYNPVSRRPSKGYKPV